jgi:signal peptidase I
MKNYRLFALRLASIWILSGIALMILGTVAGIKLSKFRPYVVSQGSMEPTLYRGDRIFVNEEYYDHHVVADGDVVVLRHGDALVVKRILALPGETIEGRDGSLIRNGIPLVEPYVAYDKDNSLDIETFSSRRVPENEIFVAGDSRDHSFDSRSADYGPVRTEDVVGRVAYVYWSSHAHQRGRSF